MGVAAVYPLMSVPIHAGRAAVTLVGSANTGPALAHAAFAGPRSVSRSSLATERSLLVFSVATRSQSSRRTGCVWRAATRVWIG